jgi:YVTN family beta-propeller protein
MLVYVVHFGSDNVFVINTATNTVVATIAVGDGPISFGNFIKSGVGACAGTPTTFTVTVNPSITASITQTGNNLTATSTPPLGTGAVYQWSTGANTATISITANGIYTVTVTDANGCSATRTINAIITSIDNNNTLAGNLSLYPNPTDGIITLSFDNIANIKGNIVLFNALGQVIKTIPLSFEEGHEDAKMTIDLTQQAAGVYFLKIESLGGKMIRIVKQ